jgi:hypothetical protein
MEITVDPEDQDLFWIPLMSTFIDNISRRYHSGFYANLAHDDVSSIQHYVKKFVSDFLRVLKFPPPIKLTATI